MQEYGNNESDFEGLYSVNVISQAPPVKFSGDEDFRISDGGLASGVSAVPSRIIGSWTARTRGSHDLENSYVEDGVVYLGEDCELYPPGNDVEDSFAVRYVDPDEETVEEWYDQMSKQAIWFTNHDMHDELPELPRLESFEDAFEGYEKANEMLTDAALEMDDSGKFWVNDFQCFLGPQMIKDEDEDSTVVYTHHTPFARNPESFAEIPGSEQMVEGLAASDGITVHTHEDMKNLINIVDHMAASDDQEFRIGEDDLPYFELGENGRTYVKRSPIGVDLEEFSSVDPEIVENVGEKTDTDYLAFLAGRNDPTKNQPDTIRAFKKAKKEYGLPKDAKLILKGESTGSGIDVYDSEDKEIEELADFKIEDWKNENMPEDGDVGLLNEFLPLEELKAWYGRADQPLATSKRDGWNLVGVESTLSNHDSDHNGITMIGEGAGASENIAGEDKAVAVDGYNIDEMAQAMAESYQMSDSERSRRMKNAAESVPSTEAWVNDIDDLMKKVE